jgi:hypothetical protein
MLPLQGANATARHQECHAPHSASIYFWMQTFLFCVVKLCNFNDSDVGIKRWGSPKGARARMRIP